MSPSAEPSGRRLRLLADENLARDFVEALRARGHDVAWVRDDAPSTADPAVLARAVAEGRTVITFDKDFGELAFSVRLTASVGVLLFRLKAFPRLAPLVVAVVEGWPLDRPGDWSGMFASVTERDGILVVRLRPIPVGLGTDN